MPFICNGDSNKSFKASKYKSAVVNASVITGDKNESIKDPFRGFTKRPIVLCERFNITPYLNKEHTLPPDSSNKMENVLNVHNVPIIYQSKCSVTVKRDDLEKLKRTLFEKNSGVIENNQPNETTMNGSMELKCNICDKVYSSEKKLQNHQEKKHVLLYKPQSKTQKRVSFSDTIIVHEVKEYHRCRKCPKIFEDYNTLKIHMKQKHKKRKCYICFYCSKDFVDRTFFKVHIKLHCDMCGLLLPNKKKYNEHRRNICRVVKKYECKTCDDIYFHFMDLKDHSYDHLGEFFICDICKDQFQSKCAVAHHIKFLHSKKRPKSLFVTRNFGIDRVYLCNFCDESSVDKEIIENHVSLLPDLQNRAMTGYKDYYFCDQCLKKFSTETDMLQHKWTHFLKSSDNSPEQKSESKKKKIKMTYNISEELPEFLKPKLVLEKIKIPVTPLPRMQPLNFVDVTNFNLMGDLKKPLIDPKSKKTIISKHRCEKCGKYLSTNYCLTRHMLAVHGVSKEDFNSLQCRVCEEIFVWPSLLSSHNCIRMNIPEMPFDDARPEIHFDNLHDNGFDDLNITDSDDLMNAVDFEIPAPIVQLTEYENFNIVINNSDGQLNVINNMNSGGVPSNNVNSIGYKVTMQQVPIEF